MHCGCGQIQFVCCFTSSHGALQVPRDITEEQLAPLFDQCGEVLHLNILRTQKGQSSGVTLCRHHVLPVMCTSLLTCKS